MASEEHTEHKEHMLWFMIVLVLVLFAGSVFLFNKDKPKPNIETPVPTHRTGRVYTVFYTSGVFSPTNMQISIGDTVRFKNDSLTSIRVVSDPHPEHDELPGFDSVSEIPSQGVFPFTFVTKGIFGYHNESDPEQSGTIIVQ